MSARGSAAVRWTSSSTTSVSKTFDWVEKWLRGHGLTVWPAEKDAKRPVVHYLLFARRG